MGLTVVSQHWPCTDAQVQLEGTCDDESAGVRGTSRDAPRVMFNARLALIAD